MTMVMNVVDGLFVVDGDIGGVDVVAAVAAKMIVTVVQY